MAARATSFTRSHDEMETRYFEDELETTCSIQQAQREVIEKLAMAWKKHGWKIGDFHILLETGGFQVSTRTIRRWSIEGRCNTSPTSQPVALGRPRLLKDEQAEVVAGYFLDKNERGQPATVHDAIDFARESFGINMCITTARKLLDDCHLSSRAAKRATLSSANETGDLAKICSDWIRTQRNNGLFPANRGLFGSIDFTYTRHTTTTLRTFAVKGWFV